jgi:hypothetical protein
VAEGVLSNFFLFGYLDIDYVFSRPRSVFRGFLIVFQFTRAHRPLLRTVADAGGAGGGEYGPPSSDFPPS